MSLTSAERQQLFLEWERKEAALAGMLAYRSYMAETGSIEFTHEPAAHHRLIIERLEALERGDIRKLLIMAPPGSAKTTYGSIQFVSWYLAKHPNHPILCCSNTESLAQSLNRKRRNIALLPEWQVLSETKLASDLQGVEHFGTEAQGGCKAAGVGSSIVGYRSFLNVLDDPIASQEEALSATALDKQWDWYNAEYRTRLIPEGRELVIGTRWARRDIPGRILDLVEEGAEEWSVLRLPMVCDETPDPMGRSVGELLWPNYFPEVFVADKRRNEFIWLTQYQQRPLDESGAWVKPEHLIAESVAPENLKYVIAVDLALSVGRGDYTVIVVAGLDFDRHLHIVHVERERITPEVTVARLEKLCELFSPLEVLIDDDNASKVLIRLMIALYHSRGQSPPPLNPQPLRGRDKETRAAAIRGLFLSGQVHILEASWTATLQRELLAFPSGSHDDQVDALGLIGRRYPMLSSPQAAKSAPDPWAGKLIRPGTDGRMYTNATLDEMFEDHKRSLRRRGR